LWRDLKVDLQTGERQTGPSGSFSWRDTLD